MPAYASPSGISSPAIAAQASMSVPLVMGTTRDIAFQLPINPPRMIHQLVAVFAKLCHQPKASSS